MRSVILAVMSAGAAVAQQGAYGQCGGIGWAGATTCVSGYHCVANYSQCVPGAASSAPPVSTTLTPSTTVGGSTPSTTLTGGTSTGSAGVGPGTTLQSGYYWVRAVSSPNFHQYIQSNPLYTASKAVLGSYLTAGQFEIVDGQLEQLLTPGNYLYAVVEQNTTAATKLGVSFSTTKNTFGTWAWNGDDLQWSTPGITRPNLSAMYVCENNDLYLNLGAYLYLTPAGCFDQTLHYYNAANANN